MSLDSIQLLKEVETPGIQEFPEQSGKNAYGIKFNQSTGALDLIRLSDGDFIKLPDDNIINEEDYTEVVWSNKLLNFSWATSHPGHLQVEIV